VRLKGDCWFLCIWLYCELRVFHICFICVYLGVFVFVTPQIMISCRPLYYKKLYTDELVLYAFC